jgi:hypothetical protein
MAFRLSFYETPLSALWHHELRVSSCGVIGSHTAVSLPDPLLTG